MSLRVDPEGRPLVVQLLEGVWSPADGTRAAFVVILSTGLVSCPAPQRADRLFPDTSDPPKSMRMDRLPQSIPSRVSLSPEALGVRGWRRGGVSDQDALPASPLQDKFYSPGSGTDQAQGPLNSVTRSWT